MTEIRLKRWEKYFLIQTETLVFTASYAPAVSFLSVDSHNWVTSWHFGHPLYIIGYFQRRKWRNLEHFTNYINFQVSKTLNVRNYHMRTVLNRHIWFFQSEASFDYELKKVWLGINSSFRLFISVVPQTFPLDMQNGVLTTLPKIFSLKVRKKNVSKNFKKLVPTHFFSLDSYRSFLGI